MAAKLKTMVKVLHVLPIASADCERGFSQMNLHHSSSRNWLVTESVSDLMMIGINGSPVTQWNAVKYAVSRLQSGKHSAFGCSYWCATKER